MTAADGDGFGRSRALLEQVVSWLGGAEAATADHGELERRVEVDGRELLRRLLQDHLDLRAHDEARLGAVVDVDGVGRGGVEVGHQRCLTTVFGEVTVTRFAYRARGLPNLHPADAVLNLPVAHHSHGIRRLAAIEASRGSFDDAVDAVRRTTGQGVGKRQVESLAGAAAVDFDDFYRARRPPPAEGTDVIVLSCDGKGIVMRPGALRAATASAAAKAKPKLVSRLSKGEKTNRKRMAEVVAVYAAAPVPRTPGDILASSSTASDDVGPAPAPAPKAKDKWVMASVATDAASAIGAMFDEAERRDPGHRCPWAVLVDGNNHQIHRVQAEARERKVEVVIVCDFVHVLEYLWRAAWSFYSEGDPAAEAWVHEKASAVLAGGATRVAAAIRRKATYHGLDKSQRANADACAGYLTAKAPYLGYPEALSRGWPIATGIIEGACRHLVKDRMDITGARWGLGGAETVLKLRALRVNGDFDDYWDFHLTRERSRVHEARYLDNVIPRAA
ncbi:MAG: ISKra4 family transposase [Acidimicrobiales bacterium]